MRKLLQESAGVLRIHGMLCALFAALVLLSGKAGKTFFLAEMWAGVWAAGNYLWMGKTVQRVLSSQSHPNHAARLLRHSYTTRSLVGLLMVAFGVMAELPLVALIVPLMFPRLAITILRIGEQRGIRYGA